MQGLEWVLQYQYVQKGEFLSINPVKWVGFMFFAGEKIYY